MDLKNKTVVFQGDSITDMNRARDNFWDGNHLYGHSFVFLLAGFFGYELPEKNITVYNRGVGGDRCVDMQARWETDTLSLNPDVISVLIGINDIILDIINNSGVTAQQYEEVLKKLVLETKEKRPQTEFIICEPFAFPESAAEEYRCVFKGRVPQHQQVAFRVARECGCLFVPLQEAFNAAYNRNKNLGYKHWIWDGVHPTAAGHQIIAAQWKKVVLGENK